MQPWCSMVRIIQVACASLLATLTFWTMCSYSSALFLDSNQERKQSSWSWLMRIDCLESKFRIRIPRRVHAIQRCGHDLEAQQFESIRRNVSRRSHRCQASQVRRSSEFCSDQAQDDYTEKWSVLLESKLYTEKCPWAPSGIGLMSWTSRDFELGLWLYPTNCFITCGMFCPWFLPAL